MCSIEPDHIRRKHQLTLLGAVVVCGRVVSMLIPQLGAEHDRRSDPVVPGDVVLRVFRLEAGSLTLEIVEVLVADDECIFPPDLPADVVDGGPIRGKAG